MSKSSNKKPKISVVMPFYNAEKFLDESIQSILNQTFTDFEFIIINDASTDNSDKVVQKYLKDKRIIYIKNKENKGIVHNLNKGIKIAKADVIARMDGDDISMPERFEKQYRFMQDNKDISIIGAQAQTINTDGKKLEKMSFETDVNIIEKKFFYIDNFLHPLIMYRKKDVINVGLYREQFNLVEDNDLYLRLLFGEYRGANLNSTLLEYRKHDNSTDKYFKRKVWRLFKMRIQLLVKYKVLDLKKYLYTFLNLVLGFMITSKMRNRLVVFVKSKFKL